MLSLVAVTQPKYAAAARSAAPSGSPLRIAVDASAAAQTIYHVRVTMPVKSGPFSFVYPKWIPGYHGPTGPIEASVDLRVNAGATNLGWRRDRVDFYAFDTNVPAATSSLDISYDIVGAASHNGQSDVVSTSQLAVLEFSNFAICPRGATAEGTPVRSVQR